MKFSWDRTSRILVVLAVAVIVACTWYKPIETLAGVQVDAGLKRSLISFATARGLNAVISVAQGTEVAVQPLGFGITLTVGQVLDPVNDLVEQFSSLMLMASVAFGIQKALLAIGSNWLISTVVTAAAGCWAVLHLWGRAPEWLSRLVVVLLMIRFAIPVVTIGSDRVFENFLRKDYEASQQAIDTTSRKIELLAPAPPAVGDLAKGLLERMKERVTAPITEIKGKYGEIKEMAERAAEKIVALIVIFLLQTVIVPILLLWMLHKSITGLLRRGDRET